MSSDTTTGLPVTEQENPRTRGLSELPTAEVLRLMNEEDAGIAAAVGRVLPEVERAVEGIVTRLRAGGRLFYVGTGTSGRLGVLDASECRRSWCRESSRAATTLFIARPKLRRTIAKRARATCSRAA